MNWENCPNCLVSLQGEPIPEHYVAAGFYGNSTHYRREIGIEMPDIYDGVLYWMCPVCGFSWARTFLQGSALNRLSMDAVMEANSRLLGNRKEDTGSHTEADASAWSRAHSPDHGKYVDRYGSEMTLADAYDG